MANCFVGDIQGCYDDLRRLLDLAEFDFDNDTLWLCGDLVARGRTPSTPCVSSNHWGSRPSPCSATTTCTCWRWPTGSPAQEKRQAAGADGGAGSGRAAGVAASPSPAGRTPRPAHHDGACGPLPAWDAHTARSCAREVESLLRGDQYSWLLHNMYGDQPDSWNDNLLGIERYRYIINSFTRMRFLLLRRAPRLQMQEGPHRIDPGPAPWFEQREHHVDDPILVFGHWAALMGNTGKSDIKGLDTGCVWGNSLTLWRYEDDALIATPARPMPSDERLFAEQGNDPPLRGEQCPSCEMELKTERARQCRARFS